MWKEDERGVIVAPCCPNGQKKLQRSVIEWVNNREIHMDPWIHCTKMYKVTSAPRSQLSMLSSLHRQIPTDPANGFAVLWPRGRLPRLHARTELRSYLSAICHQLSERNLCAQLLVLSRCQIIAIYHYISVLQGFHCPVATLCSTLRLLSCPMSCSLGREPAGVPSRNGDL